MKLPNLPFLDKKEKSEYFLSLVLRDEKASAVVFKEVAGRIDVVGEHNESFKTSLEKADEEELLSVVDRAVSTAEKSLPEDVESQKTIFGLKQSWINDGKIMPERLKKLKKISDELQFKPVGFLVITEAIVHLISKQEGAPLSAIIVEVSKNSISITLTKAGKILESKKAETEGSIPTAVDNLLKHFTTAEVLPSKIVIFDNGSERLQQEFISHKWSKELGFLHVPQITILPANFDARAVLSGAASQMGFSVIEESLKHAEKEDKEEISQETEENVENENKTIGEVASEFGFSDDDIGKKPKTAVVDNDEIDTDNITIADQFKEIPEEIKIANSDSIAFPLIAAGLFTSIKSSFKKIKLGEVKNKFKKGGSKKKLLLLIIPIALLILLLVYYFFFRSADVTLGVFSEEVDKSATVIFSESDNTSAENDVINVIFVSTSQDGKVSKAATGKKETGDKAKGTVTIFNNGDTGITLAAGTVLTSTNDLNFTLDKAISVASASGDIFSGTEPGKENVSVTAETFGTNYNLPSDTKFEVEGSTTVAGKNDNAFTGGTTKQLTVVSQIDLDELAEILQEQLEEDAKKELSNKANDDTVILPDFSSVEFESRSFSKDLEDEAKEVNLTGTINFESVSYNKSELASFAKEKLKDDISEGMKIDEDKLVVVAEKITTEEGITTAEIKIKATLVPEINTEEAIESITGKSISEAVVILQKIPGVEKVDIKIFINLPLIPQKLPFSSNDIKMILKENG